MNSPARCRSESRSRSRAIIWGSNPIVPILRQYMVYSCSVPWTIFLMRHLDPPALPVQFVEHEPPQGVDGLLVAAGLLLEARLDWERFVQVDAEDFLRGVPVGARDLDDLVEPPGPKQRRVDEVRAVR